MEDHNKKQFSTNLEKKTWAMPELIVIDKKVIANGFPAASPESIVYGNES